MSMSRLTLGAAVALALVAATAGCAQFGYRSHLDDVGDKLQREVVVDGVEHVSCEEIPPFDPSSHPTSLVAACFSIVPGSDAEVLDRFADAVEGTLDVVITSPWECAPLDRDFGFCRLELGADANAKPEYAITLLFRSEDDLTDLPQTWPDGAPVAVVGVP